MEGTLSRAISKMEETKYINSNFPLPFLDSRVIKGIILKKVCGNSLKPGSLGAESMAGIGLWGSDSPRRRGMREAEGCRGR